jgi:hypothetical protein
MNLVERVKRILLTPAAEWQVIEAEATTPAEVYKGYVMPLAAIGPIAQVIGFSVLGIRMPFGGAVYRIPIGSAVAAAVVTYLLALLGVYLLALIIDGLAPTFGGTRNRVQALKTVAYSSTAYWVAGIFTLIPGLRVLGILGLYSIYLLYLGLAALMKAPSDRAGAYAGVVILAAVALMFLMWTIGGRLMGAPVY